MATRQKPRTRQHHSQAQARDETTHAFRASQSDEQLYRMVAAVARAVLPDESERLGQAQFDTHRERVARELGEPTPLKANAIYTRLNRGKVKGERRPWKQIVEHALAGNHERRVSVDERAEPAWFQDEGYLVYSLRRVADQLGIKRGDAGCPPDAFDRARRELLAADRRLRRGDLLEELLLTSGQITLMAGGAGWDGAWELAGFQPSRRLETPTGFDPLRMLAHFYETKPGLPAHYEELRKHAAAMDIPLPAERSLRWTELRDRFIAERAEAGLETPKQGPLPEQALPPEQIEALLDGAPRQRRKGHWLVLENVVEALADYVDAYEAREPLRQKQYLAVYAEHDWPPPSRITACAKQHRIGAGESPFRAMLDLGRKRARERRRKAA